MVGNPGKQLGWMSEYGQRLDFNAEGIAQCSESKEKYKLENKNKIVKL
jgi:UDP-2-acetamido-3-amino-2,3-dideoxy-glucuronate N-acetyltransferase